MPHPTRRSFDKRGGRTIKCAWCGQVLPLTHKGRPRQHLNGGQQCLGNGSLAATHDMLRNAKKEPS